jgi:hypothetical protein
MRKIFFNVIFAFALTACTFNDVIALIVSPTPPPPDTPTPTVFYTPSRTPTITPVPPTLTFTSTPTPFGANSADVDSPVFTPFPTSTPAPQISLFGSQGSLLVSLSVSSDILYWGYCEDPHYVDFDVRLTNNIRVKFVLLFMRLEDKGGNQSTAWGGGAIMRKVDGSHYTYRVRPENIAYYEEFKDAWIEYQVVVANSSLSTLARTPVYRESLSLKWCRPIEVNE